ncbi:helix-turn-helix domain-containing protein [Galbibacter sp. EGI 63066]|uniref:helix-turn-helix domain-containing protein n=1 Tax=Galbibacter sp. EGI 63066 TaxID=2993559 RepID=UPI0022492791|nr:helix-turn-helix domain-containing protein [Galbibacter sp. EGI 63066]MCX2681956.1 helix-turn-helix domain-containing protein [Galbibacter sp. EGI 63066]
MNKPTKIPLGIVIMKYSILFTFIFFIGLISNAQKNGSRVKKQFDSVFYDVAVRVSSIDMGKAETIADSLYRTSKTEIHKIKSLMLLADLLQRQSKREKAIDYALIAEQIANTSANAEWKARIYGFLSTQYRIVGLTDLGREYLQKGLENSKDIRIKSVSDQYLGMVYQEMAHYAMNDENYLESVSLLRKVNKLFRNMQNEKSMNFFLGNNEEMLGRSFLGMKVYDSSKYHYNRALEFLNKAGAENSQWTGLIYRGKGLILLEEKKYVEAKQFLDKALLIAESMDHMTLKSLVYKDVFRYYKETGNQEGYIEYNRKYLNEIKGNIKAEKVASNAEVNRILKKQQRSFSQLYKLIIGIVVLLLVSLVFIFITKRKQRKDRERYLEIISKLELERQEEISKLSISEINDISERIHGSNSSYNRPMQEETEMMILEKLQEFENQNEFLDSEFTLTKLSAKFNINPKYLSWVINEHKKKDFNNYINQLRIFYIIKKMRNDFNYLNYKISYLSSECGFSSHSKFTAIFKKETGLTPSYFINQLRKENVDGKV